MSINIDNACNIQGWMTYKELKWLAKQARKYQRIVEIGSLFGRSTRALADNTEGMVYAVDDFIGPRDATIPSFLKDNIFETFLWQTRDLIEQNKITPVIIDHKDAYIEAPDMVFIDGSHKFEDVQRDIALWYPLLQKGGLICGHDYTKRAVDGAIGKFKIAKDTSIWYAKA